MAHRFSSLLRVVIGFTLMCSAAVVLIAIDLVLLPWRSLRIRAGNIYGKLVGPSVAWLAGARVDIRNGERINTAAPAIYITNHTSSLDVFISMWLCPMGGCGIAKKEVGKIPFFGWSYALSGHLLLDRHNRDNAIKAFESTAATVKKHDLSVWIWPEGTRSLDGRLLPLKKGFVHMAIATGLPIVPVILHGAHHRWPGKTLALHPGRLEIDVLQPIDTQGWSTTTVQDHVDQVHTIMTNALAPEQRPLVLSEHLGQASA